MKEKRILKITAIVHSFSRWKRGCLKLTITGNVHNVWIWTNELCKYKLFEASHNSQKIKSYSAGRFPDFIDLNNLKEIDHVWWTGASNFHALLSQRFHGPVYF